MLSCDSDLFTENHENIQGEKKQWEYMLCKEVMFSKCWAYSVMGIQLQYLFCAFLIYAFLSPALGNILCREPMGTNYWFTIFRDCRLLCNIPSVLPLTSLKCTCSWLWICVLLDNLTIGLVFFFFLFWLKVQLTMYEAYLRRMCFFYFNKDHKFLSQKK